MQHEITRPCELLNENGLLKEPGWARQPLWRYDREKIQASRMRIKEWDYYSLENKKINNKLRRRRL
ncbi:MAG: DUF2804 family protein [bacterium]|nr:DUF2804 family protein [bacterium]